MGSNMHETRGDPIQMMGEILKTSENSTNRPVVTPVGLDFDGGAVAANKVVVVVVLAESATSNYGVHVGTNLRANGTEVNFDHCKGVNVIKQCEPGLRQR